MKYYWTDKKRSLLPRVRLHLKRADFLTICASDMLSGETIKLFNEIKDAFIKKVSGIIW